MFGQNESAAQRGVETPSAFCAAFFVTWTVAVIISAYFGPDLSHPIRHLIYGDVERLVCWILLPLGWLFWVERRNMMTAFRPVVGISKIRAWCAALGLAVLLLLGMRLTRGQWHMIPTGQTWPHLVAVIASIGLLSFGEEFTFRGVLLSGLIRRGMRFGTANLLVAVAFAFSHWPGWLALGTMPVFALLTASLRVFVFGLVMGWLVRQEGGLFTAILVHAFNDVLAGTLF